MHDKQRNHLDGQKSPYLLQHVDNPVDWYPWEEAALQKAQREQKPILLSQKSQHTHNYQIQNNNHQQKKLGAKLVASTPSENKKIVEENRAKEQDEVRKENQAFFAQKKWRKRQEIES